MGGTNPLMATPSGAQLRKRYRLATRAVAGVTFVCLVLSVWLASDWAGARAYDEQRAAARESLSLQIEALTGMLEKYRLLPALLSKRADIRNMFGEGGGPLPESIHDLLMDVTTASSAADVLVADTNGHVLGSARGLLGTDTIKASPLPAAVAQHRLGRAALRLNDGARAYAFASRIAHPVTGDNVGMIIVLAPFTPIEANWSLSRNPIFVTDTRELIFLSNRLEWSGRPWQASGVAHGDEPLSARAGDLVRVRERGGANYVEVSRPLPILGWTMHVLADSAPIETARRNAAAVAGLAVILVGLSIYLVIFRQELNRSRMRREKAQSMRLERLVRDRTAELSTVNAALRTEVDVRRQTEQQLRDTQDELVHAAKLAVIGQMSATLSHEYNQPLAAIKTYAGNATTMIAKGKLDGLGDVLARIEQMVDRMSVLSKTLLSFSRKPGTTLHPATIDSIVSEACSSSARRRASRASLCASTSLPTLSP